MTRCSTGRRGHRPALPLLSAAAALPVPLALPMLSVMPVLPLVPALVAGARRETFVVGLDLSADMLAIGRAKLSDAGRTNAALIRADAGQLPFRAASFDAVTVSFGLHELPTSVRERAAREVVRVLRPDGVLLAADLDLPPRFAWLVDAYLRLGEPAHAREVTGDGLVCFLRKAGFTVEHQGPAGAVPMQILVARPADR